MISSTEAIVLNKKNFGDTSLICNLYSKDYGKIAIIAKGAKSLKNPLGAILQPMNYLDCVYYYKSKRSIQIIKEAAARTADEAGDGTTTSTVLAQAIYNEGLKMKSAGFQPDLLKQLPKYHPERPLSRLNRIVLPPLFLLRLDCLFLRDFLPPFIFFLNRVLRLFLRDFLPPFLFLFDMFLLDCLFLRVFLANLTIYINKIRKRLEKE